jgi:hypothetical protein
MSGCLQYYRRDEKKVTTLIKIATVVSCVYLPLINTFQFEFRILYCQKIGNCKG